MVDNMARLPFCRFAQRNCPFSSTQVMSERVTEQLRHDFVAYLYDSYTRSARQRDRLREDSLDSVTLGSGAWRNGEGGDCWGEGLSCRLALGLFRGMTTRAHTHTHTP